MFQSNRLQYACFALACLMPLGVLAQTYPSKTILLINSNPAGNSGDTAVRMTIPMVSAALGQTLIMENRTAAGGQVATLTVKKSPADGYTILVTGPSHAVRIFMLKNPGYDAYEDFAPVTRVISVPSLFAVSASVPTNNIKEFVDYAKRNPGVIAYGSTGVGTAFHMMGESFASETGIDMLHVPYVSVGGRPGVPTMDLAADRLQLYFPSFISLLPVIKGGKVKVLAVLGPNRLSALPDVPSILESMPNATLIPTAFGLVGPAGMPRPIVQRLQTEFKKALQDPQIRSKLEGMGTAPGGNTPEEWGEEIRASVESVGKVFKALKLEPE